MSPEARARFRFVETAVDQVLIPLGFTKRKAIWRRSIRDVLQQFSIVSKQVAEKYRPEWGLNILSRCEDPAPLPWKLSVRWIFEMQVEDLARRLEYLECFDFGFDLAQEIRQERIEELLRSYVIPCFDAFTTEEAVRRMMSSKTHPLRAHSFVRLPDDWWPGGRHPGAGANRGDIK